VNGLVSGAAPRSRLRTGVHDRGLAFTMAEAVSRWLEIDRRAGRVISGFFALGSAVDAEREDLYVQVEAADRAASQ